VDAGRITAPIARLFHVRYSLRGTSYLPHRIGFSPQVPVHRYRMCIHRGRKGERRSMSEGDYAGLITAAHHQLRDPVA
jgi:hypothetical protein